MKYPKGHNNSHEPNINRGHISFIKDKIENDGYRFSKLNRTTEGKLYLRFYSFLDNKYHTLIQSTTQELYWVFKENYPKTEFGIRALKLSRIV